MSLMQIYRVSRKWKVISAVAIPPLIVLFGLFMFMPFFTGRSNETAAVLLSFLLGGGLMLYFLYALLSVFKGRIEVYSDRIRDVGLFQTRELFISDISGFRILTAQSPLTLLLAPKNSSDKKIKTALMVEHKEELLDWLNRNLTNLDNIEHQEEMNQILHDVELGSSEEQRLELLGRARRWSRILNVLAFVSILWVIFKPQPYTYAIWTLVLLPLIALYSVMHFEGALRFDGKQNSAYPDVTAVLLLPCLGLALRALVDFNILNWGHFWLPFAVFSLSTFILALFFARDVTQKVSPIITLVIFCIIYGYSAVITLNGILDKAPPSIYHATVIQKRISRGKRTSYYFELSLWGPRKEPEEVDVGKSVFNRHETGDSIEVMVKHGKFGIPWFYVR